MVRFVSHLADDHVDQATLQYCTVVTVYRERGPLWRLKLYWAQSGGSIMHLILGTWNYVEGPDVTVFTVSGLSIVVLRGTDHHV